MVTVADTAFSIAFVRAQEGEMPTSERLFEDPFAAHFHAGGADAWESTQRFLALPFFRDGIRLRTRYLDDFVRDGLAAGITQVVVLGAGFDARGHRLDEIPSCGARVFEVDFDAQFARKRALLAAGGVSLPAWLAHVPCDLLEPDFDGGLAASLEASGFRPGAGALFVWEGVTPYIDEAAVDRCLAFMARVGGPGTRAGFDFGTGRFERPTLAERVLRAGFSTCDEAPLDAVWLRYLPGEPHPNAWVCRIAVAMV
jgi:methyltransferase (TIGR00027 family)